VAVVPLPHRLTSGKASSITKFLAVAPAVSKRFATKIGTWLSRIAGFDAHTAPK